MPLVSYFEHNKLERGDLICSHIEAGETCAPGDERWHGLPAISTGRAAGLLQASERNPAHLCGAGPSAVVSALAISGLLTGRFTF